MWSLAGCFDASGSFVQCACQLPLLHLGMCVLEELHLFERLVVVCFIGVETALRSSSSVASSATAASTSEEEGLHAALFFTASARTSATSLCTSEEKGLHTAFLFTTSACTSEEEGKAFFLTKIGEFLGGGGTGPPHNVGLYFGGGETGLLPRNVGEYMQLVLRCVLSMSASRGVPIANALVLGNNASVGSLVTATHLEENSSGASWVKESRSGPGFILHVDDL